MDRPKTAPWNALTRARRPQNNQDDAVDKSNVLRLFHVVVETSRLSTAEQLLHAWNPADCSPNIYVKENDAFTMHRRPAGVFTDGIRGKTGFSEGFHVWQITWPSHLRGTHAAVGIATKNAALRSIGYKSLVGANNESIGWDIVSNKGCYNSRTPWDTWVFPSMRQVPSAGYSVSDTFYVILDADRGILAYATADLFIGCLFTRLRDGFGSAVLYPMISTVVNHSEVTIRYVGGLTRSTLLDICRTEILKHLVPDRLDRIAELGLPRDLQRYLLDEEQDSTATVQAENGS